MPRPYICDQNKFNQQTIWFMTETTLSHGIDTLPGQWRRGFIAGAALLIAVWAQLQPSYAGTSVKLNLTAAPGGGKLLLHLQGQSGQVYQIEASTDLKNWIVISTNQASGSGALIFSDPQAGQFRQRFYRAVAWNNLTGLGSAGFRPDRILVKPKTGITLSTLNLTLGASALNVFPAMGNLHVLKVPAGMTASTLIDKYKVSGLVQYAEHDYYVQALNDPNDPHYVNGDMWDLKNAGQNGGTPGADIHASAAWDIITSASNIIVAVPDTGVRYTHEDLAANMWVNPADGSHGTNTIAANTDPNDDYGHGTHVSGTIGAVGNNGLGIVGVCWNVQIMALKFLDSTGNGTMSDAIACLDYARTHGAKVVNASWGTTNFTSQALHDAIASLRDADIIFVAAAGNSSADNDTTLLYPSSYRDLDNVVAVAATDLNDQLAGYSDYGTNTVDLAAPGGTPIAPILSCWNGSDTDYETDDGTSMACAHVTGAVALLRAYYPGENHKQIIQRILSGTDPLPSLIGKTITGGRLDLAKALGSGSSQPPVITLTATQPDAYESGSVPGVINFHRTGDTSQSYEVYWTFSGTASNGVDYESLPTNSIFPAGQSDAPLTITPIDRGPGQPDKTVTVTLAPGSAYQIGASNSATVIIHSNSSSQLPVITLTATTPDAYESGSVPGVINVHRTGDTSQAYEVYWTFSGTASNGVDYESLPTNSIFPAGQSDAPLTITPIDRGPGQGDKTVIVTLAPGPAYQIGASNSATIIIHGTVSAPVASFTANPTSGQAPLVVQFTDTSTGNPTAWNWNFGDGSTNSTQSPSHTYGSAGSFTATLTVSGSSNQSSTATQTITVTNAPGPVAASFTANPTSGQTPLAVQFTDQSSGPVTSWNWSFGDGATSSTQSPSHTYNSAGNFTATLAVTGSGGQTSRVSQTITVTSPPPPVTASFTATPSSGQAPLTVQFADQSSGPVTSWNWDFGDGTTSSSQNPSHTYDAAGSFTATLTVAGSAGQTSSTSQAITVVNAPPPPLSTVTVRATTPAASILSPGVFTITRTGDTSSVLTVHYSLGGSAQNGVDYETLSGLAAIPAGESTASVVVQPDGLLTVLETVKLTLSSDSSYQVGSPNSATVTIVANALGGLGGL
jgi:PKD repeat protein/subtilisin family serine protease